MSYGGILPPPPCERAACIHHDDSVVRELDCQVDRRESNPLPRGHIPVAHQSPSANMESGYPESNRDHPLIKRVLCL